jgi:hypothetical protein
MRYGVFCGSDGYPTDMRNTNRRFDLWQIRSFDYPTDMRKSIPDQEMWQSDFLRRGAERARGSHAMSFEQSKTPGYAQSRLSLTERVRFSEATIGDTSSPPLEPCPKSFRG